MRYHALKVGTLKNNLTPMYGTTIDKVLPGKVIKKIFFDKQNLRLETDLGNFTYEVDGDCCSHSEFWDFYGVKNLIGSRVISVSEVELDPSTGSRRPDGNDDSTQYYGYKIVAENEKWGEITAVFSFRNISNGYYGGSLRDGGREMDNVPQIKSDVTEAADSTATPHNVYE